MDDFSRRAKRIGNTRNTVIYSIEADPDIVVIDPLEGTKDTAEDARENAAFIVNHSLALQKPLGVMVIMANMLAQEAEARRAYAEIEPKYSYAAALVVDNALSRALGSFFVGLTRPIVPTKLFNSVESALDWLRTMRPK